MTVSYIFNLSRTLVHTNIPSKKPLHGSATADDPSQGHKVLQTYNMSLILPFNVQMAGNV
jgi:hypothetical protein